MGATRTKVDALKDLGEKVTGSTLDIPENETIVGILDKITDKYSGGGSGGGAGVGKLTITYSDNTYTLDETSIAYLNTLTADNLPASFLVTMPSGDNVYHYMNYFSNIFFSDEGNSFTIYYYDVGQKRYNVLTLEQYEGEWDVIAES